MNRRSRMHVKSYLRRALMIVPPILFLVYVVHSLVVIRGLMSASSSFHLDYANDLIQDYLEMELVLEVQNLRACLRRGEPCRESAWLTLDPVGERYSFIPVDDTRAVPVHLKPGGSLQDSLVQFINSKAGLSALFEARHHEPVYWAAIHSPDNNLLYESGVKPQEAKAYATYTMDRSLKGYSLEIAYRSFGPKQLYSVAQSRINFSVIFLLFILAVFSLVLITWSIRHKLQMIKQKTLLVSTLSHEFKTPLAIMRLAAETLESKRFRSEEEERKFLSMISNEINRLNHLVFKILNYNKIESGRVMFHQADLDLREVFQRSAEAFRIRAKSEGVELEIETCDASCPIWGDADLIRHALDNIVDNAFKYRGDSKRVELGLKRIQDTAQVQVRDYGVGISRDELRNIFKSFYRVDDPKIRGIRGSGLGLNLSSYIFKRTGAKVEVDSEPGKGSTFTITFNLIEEDPRLAAESA